MIETSRFTLDNGLRVVHNHDAAQVMVGIDIMYNVGARDEQPSRTGLAHLFEHLMFDGSVNIPDFDAAIEKAGGMNNAWTSSDFTNFYESLPAVNAETAFWLESDRMLSPAFTAKGLDVQKHVVIEEFKQTCLNEPYGDMTMGLRKLLFDTHPYRWPVIGLSTDHIEQVTMPEVKDFFFSHYAPNNAVLAVSGNITLERTHELAEKWFGPIPRRDITPRTYAPEPPLPEDRHLVMHGRVPQPMVVVAWRMPGYHEDGYIACDLLTDVLASGRSSRMYRELVMDGTLFSEADASIFGTDEPGILMLTGRLLKSDDESLRRAEEMLLDQAWRLAADGVTDHELERALNRNASNLTFHRMHVLSRAKDMAQALINGEDVNDMPARYSATTTTDLHRAAVTTFGAHHATLIYLPE